MDVPVTTVVLTAPVVTAQMAILLGLVVRAQGDLTRLSGHGFDDAALKGVKYLQVRLSLHVCLLTYAYWARGALRHLRCTGHSRMCARSLGG